MFTAQNTYFGETVWLFCVLLVLTMLGRAAFVFPFSMLHNWCSRQEEQLSFKEMIVIWCEPSDPAPLTRLQVFPAMMLLDAIF